MIVFWQGEKTKKLKLQMFLGAEYGDSITFLFVLSFCIFIIIISYDY